MAIELDTSKRTTASAEAQIDALETKIAELRVEKIFEPPAATGAVPLTGDDLEKEVKRYIMANIRNFETEHNHIKPGDRVMERDSGRVGTVQCGGRDTTAAFHPAVRYDDEPSYLSTEYGERHFIVITDEKSLSKPFPWVIPYGVPWASAASAEPSWTIAEFSTVAEFSTANTVPVVVRLSTCCDVHEASKQAAEEEAKAARGHLAKHLHDRCCTMGAHSADDPLAPNLHAYVETGAPNDALRAAQIANPAASTEAAVRTATYVAAVSEDIKKRMTGQREQWAKAVQIGAAA